MVQIRKGDSFTVGPFNARLSDGTAIDLTGAKIEASVATGRGVAPAFTRQNTAAGGGDSEIEVTDAAGGVFYVYVTSTLSDGLVANTTYYMDARVKLTTGEVYTVGEAAFKLLQPYSPIPTP